MCIRDSSTSCEIVGKVEGSINQMAKHDFVCFKELFDFDICVFDEIFESGDASVISSYENTDSPNKLFNKEVRDRICELAIRLAKAASADEFMADMVQFYKDFGVGKLGLHKAFRIAHTGENVETVSYTHLHVRGNEACFLIRNGFVLLVELVKLFIRYAAAGEQTFYLVFIEHHRFRIVFPLFNHGI